MHLQLIVVLALVARAAPNAAPQQEATTVVKPSPAEDRFMRDGTQPSAAEIVELVAARIEGNFKHPLTLRGRIEMKCEQPSVKTDETFVYRRPDGGTVTGTMKPLSFRSHRFVMRNDAIRMEEPSVDGRLPGLWLRRDAQITRYTPGEEGKPGTAYVRRSEEMPGFSFVDPRLLGLMAPSWPNWETFLRTRPGVAARFATKNGRVLAVMEIEGARGHCKLTVWFDRTMNYLPIKVISHHKNDAPNYVTTIAYQRIDVASWFPLRCEGLNYGGSQTAKLGDANWSVRETIEIHGLKSSVDDRDPKDLSFELPRVTDYR